MSRTGIETPSKSARARAGRGVNLSKQRCTPTPLASLREASDPPLKGEGERGEDPIVERGRYVPEQRRPVKGYFPSDLEFIHRLILAHGNLRSAAIAWRCFAISRRRSRLFYRASAAG